MRIWHFGCHEQIEVLIKVDVRVSKSDLGNTCFVLVLRLQKNGINSWINILLKILHKNWVAYSDCSYDISKECWCSEFHEL